MRRIRGRRQVLHGLAVWGAMLLPLIQGCANDDESSCVEPPPAPPAGICEPVDRLEVAFPADVQDPAAPDVQRQYDCLSWRTFVALNWPAAPGCRGVPDTEAAFAAGKAPRVWETYKELFEVFQSQDASWDPSEQAWEDSPPAVDCADAAAGRKVLRRTSKAPIGQNVEDEFLQALATGFGTLTDQAPHLVRYEVRINRDLFEFIIENGYAKTGAYSYNGPIINRPLFLPDDTTGFTGQGTMEIKAAWKTLTDEDDHSRYYVRETLVFDRDSDTPCREATMGLIGLHITHKNFNAPQWVWSTFEHVDNVPPLGSDGDGRRYSLFDAACVPAAPANCWSFQQPIAAAAFRCCPNLELNPHVFPAGTPNQATRLNPIRDSGLNRQFQQLLAEAGSPLQYYVLVGTEFPKGGRNPDDPTQVRPRPCNPIGAARVPPVSENCYTQIPGDLRNTSMETYMSSFGAGTVQFSSDSCMNCHGATAADLSFIWLDAMTNIVPIQ